MACKVDIADEIKDVSIAVDEMKVNIKRVRKLIADINKSTDCDNIKMKLGLTGNELKDVLSDLQDEAKEILKKIIPAIKLPAPTPGSIVGWVKKQILGNAYPQLMAYIKLLQTASELAGALTELSEAAQNAIPRLKQCANELIQEQLSNAGISNISPQAALKSLGDQFENIIEDAVTKEVSKISKEITDALCESGLLADLSAISDAIAITETLISDLGDLASSVNETMDSTVQGLGAVSNDIASVTGVPFTADTSSAAGFIDSVNNGAMDATTAAAVDLLAMEAPSVNVAPTLTGSAIVGSTLTVNVGTWNGSNIEYSYSWFRNEDPIWSANAATYVLTTSEEGFTVKCAVSAYNAVGEAVANTDPTAVVVYDPPVATVDPVITGTASVGSVLSVSDGTWVGTPTITYQWQWAHTSTNITGANTNSYTVSAEDTNRSITCVVTATSNSGVTEKVCTPTAIVSGGSTVGSFNLDTFTGNGSNTNFTLSQASATNSAIVSINGSIQKPTADYSISTTTLTFVEAPYTGDDIFVQYFGV